MVAAVRAQTAQYHHIVKIMVFDSLNFCVARTTANDIIANSFVHGSPLFKIVTDRFFAFFGEWCPLLSIGGRKVYRDVKVSSNDPAGSMNRTSIIFLHGNLAIPLIRTHGFPSPDYSRFGFFTENILCKSSPHVKLHAFRLSVWTRYPFSTAAKPNRLSIRHWETEITFLFLLLPTWERNHVRRHWVFACVCSVCDHSNVYAIQDWQLTCWIHYSKWPMASIWRSIWDEALQPLLSIWEILIICQNRFLWELWIKSSRTISL